MPCRLTSVFVQGVFRVAAAQPVNYVIEETEDLFNIDNLVSLSLIEPM